MVRMTFSIDLTYDVAEPGADFVFNLQPAHTVRQTVMAERLTISQPGPVRVYTDPVTHTRVLQLSARPGLLRLSCNATVDVRHRVANAAGLPQVPVGQLPPEVLPYLYPSRYCPSDRLMAIAMTQFGHLAPGCERVLAIQAWVREQVRFTPNSSDSTTSALDTLERHAGVCRDFAHLMIALCRALNLPARFTTGIDYGADPALGPTDFHAYVEVYLGHSWVMFDPSGTAIPMGFVRIGTGRDAADASFATIFGAVVAHPPVIDISAVNDPRGGWELPRHREELLSTDAPER